MDISWIGHSCLLIQSDGVTLLTDPFADSLGISMARPTAEIVTTSHEHPHHAHLDGVGGNPRVLAGPGEYGIGKFYVTGIGTERDNEHAVINTVFTIQAEEVTLCHLGDLNRPLSPRQVDELSHTDVLFVPAGGVCTLDTARLAELVRLVDPRIVVPLHYQSKGVLVDLEPLSAFLEDLGVAEPEPRKVLQITDSNLPRELEAVSLERAA